ncbi:antibiotic biosynthesis monooxygenase [Frankia sp. CNm7]|uniref:Antibiotic biosynthesis monooxygenase n=1 Tax=Frankia nepalensis TaxID=1836974 RepID=A0A937UNE1_9ACTN|nr:antibiotic biosynthesis monooxygenase [Frankia nepalensis]MBL7499401.1 antibiotic biosynthesis monooxygenase [Frankia nepalensis]MBL7509942.1 antibiotic biosynthesis monooxygenase [Frankia nepalensis]MBL7522708.1 antibiotic biosynthesis monooxygenase [Frankia nepalensis]MBL7629774.1 antibiotic biosynthesis monooxygenase [Frankia nepalensis]
MDDKGFYSIIDYAVDGPDSQRELVEAFAEIQRRWVSFYPGYRSARIFASVDGTRVYNVVHWVSEADFRHFEQTSDTAGRVAAIEAAVAGVRGWAKPRMTGAPRFRVAREVGPGPRPAGAAAAPTGPARSDRAEDAE